jgi:hypothetical protein
VSAAVRDVPARLRRTAVDRPRRARRRRGCGLLLLLAAVLGSPALADLVSPFGGETAPNFVEIDVLDDRVRVALEIDLADYPFFVAADDGAGRSLAARTGRTLEVQADGVPLAPATRVVDVRERRPRPSAARPVAVARPRSAEVVYAELDFPFAGRPRTLTFAPPRDAAGMPAVSLGLLVTHLGVPVTDYRYLSQPETMRPDWDDPWFTVFENPNLTRHHKSPLMSFIAVEPRAVRHEILFRLRDLETWTDLDLGDDGRLDAARLAQLERTAATFFAGRNPLVVDGVERAPAAVRVAVVEVGATGLQVVGEPRHLDRVTALLGVVLTYPHDALPGELRMTWELFARGVEAVPAVVTDPAGGVPARLTPDAPQLAWTNYLRTWEEPATAPVTVPAGPTVRVPVVSTGLILLGSLSVAGAVRSPARRRWVALALLAVAASVATARVGVLPVSLPSREPTPPAAAAIAEAMLNNAADATLETAPERFDRALTPFVAAGDVAAVGAEMRRGLAVTLPSGALARTEAIRAVAVEEVTPRDDGVVLLASWIAEVAGGHWGHLHRRDVTYRALMDVRQVDGAWMLEGLTVLGARMEPPA